MKTNGPEPMIIDDPDTPKNVSVMNILIKEFMEPIILTTIKDFRTYLENKGEDILPVVVGGAAIDAWLRSSVETVKTKDFDVRLIYPTRRYDPKWNLTKEDDNALMEETLHLAKEIVKRANNYIAAHMIEIDRLFADHQIDFEISRTDFFYLNVTGNLHVCAYKIQTEDFYGVETIMDIYPISNTATKRNWHFELFRANAELHDGMFVYPIPSTLFFDIDFAALGYCIFDLINLVHGNVVPQKTARNGAKLRSIVKVLNNPAGNLNCNMTEDFVKNCQEELQGGCTFGGRQLSNAELIQYGIDKNLFPDQADRMSYIRDVMGDKYLCNYIKRYQDRIFVDDNRSSDKE